MNTPNNNKHVPFTIKADGNVSMYLNGESHSVAADHPNYQKIVDKLKNYSFSGLDELVNVSKALTSYANGKIKIIDGEVHYGGFALHNTLTNRILKMMNEKFRFDHMILFLENLMKNSSNRAINETYTFLENYGLPITDDGCFLAYKAVKNDYTDIYSGKINNHVGATPEMPRNMVDEDYERDCSHGLHVGALDYVVQYGHFVKGEALREGGNRLLIVKVNPADVVSVPKYENHPKVRVSKYVVVSEITDVVKELEKVVYTSTGQDFSPDFAEYDDNDDVDDDEDDEDCCEDEQECNKSECENNIESDNESIADLHGLSDVDYTNGFARGLLAKHFPDFYGMPSSLEETSDYIRGFLDARNDYDFNVKNL